MGKDGSKMGRGQGGVGCMGGWIDGMDSALMDGSGMYDMDV